MNKPMIKEDYRLSLIVPVYNEEESIETFIGAINTRLASIRSHIDIVFINDGSSDNTRTVIENQIRQDDSITLVNLAKILVKKRQ